MSLRRLARAGAVLGCIGVLAAAPAVAQPPPNCTSADLTGTMTGVMAATTAYLYTHPQVNEFFSSLQGRSPEERRAALEEFLTANPQVQAELQGIRQPMKDFRNRCG
ncbi:heme-binding protein [Mycolicibacterium sp. PAM1]|uniref:Haemophore haem-binding domain-containing protein n=1 Tax=Mycolicibacterium gilvum (strain PYR-GCK) TaxID=350054 RepID=A4TF06_MYCGI|nr:heme-binding protein [Mycolicibacterium sp. PAM1]ABP47272.1 conserved hypothetical protein [Mycolicibacterium gilvum PYR-GCK]MBV5246712.1 heme-binding protein [Mycolicibacterium sp. PAM1]